MPMTETKFIREYRASLKRECPTAFIRKMPGFAMSSGLPDLYICIGGKSIWMEVKIHQGKRIFDIQKLLSPQQAAVAEQLDKAGAEVYICSVCEDRAIIRWYNDLVLHEVSYDNHADVFRVKGGLWTPANVWGI